jgi:succinyl-CoA synthetase beta subunit
MDLLEYQVKEWFGNIGIPVLPSQRIDHPTDLKRLKIPFPIVLKSQIYGGGRLKSGGVRFAETTIDAIASAQNIFNLSIVGELPEVVLAETKYNAEMEIYLAVVLDTAMCRPILLGCREGDIDDWELVGEKMQHIVVDQEFSPFYARRLALKMGLQGVLMQSVSSVIEKMYHLFREKDLDLVEINPLGINASGQVMALNGSVCINERAIARHPDIALMATKIANRYVKNDNNGNLINSESTDSYGKIGILGNGAGSVMSTMDLITNAGGKPGICLNLRHASPINASPTTFSDRLEKALKILGNDKGIQVILINLLGSIPQVNEVADVITNFIEYQQNNFHLRVSTNGSKARRQPNYLRLVIRLAGSDFDSTKKQLTTFAAHHNRTEDISISIVDNLDDAIAESIRLAKSNQRR